MKAVVLFIVATYGSLFFALMSRKLVVGGAWYLQPVRIPILGALAMAILLALPGPVVIDSSGIKQRYRWRREKYIPWSDFASVIHDRDDGSTIVYGKFESPITFSPYLVDQSRFDREVKAFSHTDEIRDDL